MLKLLPYKKELELSYTLGIFPTLEILTLRPKQVAQLVVAPNAKGSTGLQKIAELARLHAIPITEDVRTLRRLSHTENCYALAAFKKYSEELATAAPHVVLVNPDDAGNVGTIMRTMLGFGHTNLAIIRPGVDAFDPKVIRASMGARFAVNVTYFDSIEAYQARFPHHLYPFMLQGAATLQQTRFTSPYALVFGNEGAGLPEPFQYLGTAVKIEQSDAIDSLNLAVATSVALYHAFTTK